MKLSLETLYLLRQCLAQSAATGMDINSPDFHKVVTAKNELDAAIVEVETA